MSDLKIAMLVRQFSPQGGLELYTHKLVEGLLERDVSVTVVCQENFSELSHKNLSLKLIPGAGEKLSKHARLKKLFAAANKALAETDRIDLVHSQHCPTDAADVVTFHNHSSRRLSKVGLSWEKNINECKRLLIPAYRLRDEQDEILLRRARCLIFPAEVMKEDFFSEYAFLQTPQPTPYVVAHPGASMADAAPTASSHDSGADPGKFRFLFVGRGFRKKGLDILLQSCAILKKRAKNDFQLLIAGLAAKPADHLRLGLLGIQDCVKYLGFQKNMEAVYQKARVIILPSRVEPFGMAPIQGMQRGLVPIVSRVSGVSEVLHDGEDSLLLEDHLDSSELASHMEKLMNESELLSRLSANALRTSEKLSWDETVQQTLKAYEIAIQAKSREKSALSK